MSSPGDPPGLIASGPDAQPTAVSVIAYTPESLHEETLLAERAPGQPLAAATVDAVCARLDELSREWPLIWINVTGLGDAAVVQRIGEQFGLHPLVLEDVVHVRQRPKVEEYEDYNFIVTRMVHEGIWPDTEQLAIVLEQSCVITFQERHGDCLGPVRERVRRSLGRIRRTGADYLAYAILDAVVDHFMPLVDWYSERIEDVERRILASPAPRLLAEIYQLKHNLQALRRELAPMRDAIGRLHREEVPLFSEDVDPYLRDCYDHAVRLIEALEIAREASAGLLDLYMSSMSQRMNEIMKVLTIIATIFIPLSFVAGVYGMNFDPDISIWNMPELEWAYGYPFALSIMFAIAGVLLLFFRRKGWLARDEPSTDLRALLDDRPEVGARVSSGAGD